MHSAPSPVFPLLLLDRLHMPSLLLLDAREFLQRVQELVGLRAVHARVPTRAGLRRWRARRGQRLIALGWIRLLVAASLIPAPAASAGPRLRLVAPRRAAVLLVHASGDHLVVPARVCVVRVPLEHAPQGAQRGLVVASIAEQRAEIVSGLV